MKNSPHSRKIYSMELSLLLSVMLSIGCEKFDGTKETNAEADSEIKTDSDSARDPVTGTEEDPAIDSGGDVGTDVDDGVDSEVTDDSETGVEMETDTSGSGDTIDGSDTELDVDSTEESICIDQDEDDWCLPFDCNDADENINQDAEEVVGDQIDNDCDGLTDELSQKDLDMDKDGFTPNEGDCDDVGAGAEFVNPNAIEDLGKDGTGDNVDNDCDGETDEVEQCDCPEVGTGPWDFVDAIDLCNHKFVQDPTLIYSATRGVQGYDTVSAMGANDCLVPQRVCEMAAISTGPVGQPDPNKAVFLSDYPSAYQSLDPLPEFTGSTPTDGVKRASCDRAQFRLDLKAPSNAMGFSFDFLFASAEYPEWVQRGYNDTFYAIIEHPDINGGAPTNISFDADNNEIEVDVNFFENAMFPCDEKGSGWAPPHSGSTGWLKTSWNIKPNDAFTLTFSIHDEGDCRFDSIVFIDNFQWKTSPVKPGTEPI